MSDGYEYDNENSGMRAALERARAQAQPPAGDELAALEERLKQTWESPDQPSAPQGSLPIADGTSLPIVAPGTKPGEVPQHDEKPGQEKPDESWKRFPGQSAGPSAPPLPEPPGGPPPTPPPEEPWARMKHDLAESSTRRPAPEPLELKMREAGWSPDQTGQAPAGAPPARPDWQTLAEQMKQPPPAPAAPPAAAAAPPAPGPDWSALQAQIQQAEHSAGMQKSIAAMLHAAAPGFQPPANIGTDEVAAARLPLEIEQHRQQAEAQKHKQATDLLEETKKSELADPNSAVSKRAQEAYAQQFGGDARLVPAGLKQMSANEIEGLTKTAVPLSGQKNAADVAKAHDTATATEKTAAELSKKEAADKVAADEAGSLEQERALLLADPRAKKFGLTADAVAKLDRKGIAGIQHQLETMPKEKPAGAPAPHVKSGDYSTIPEADRETVRAIVEGRQKAPDPGSRFGGKILSYVTQVDPNFDATRFGAYKHVVEHQATDKDIVAARTAQEHIKQARTHIPANFDSPMLNRLRQAVLTGTGSDQMTPFEVDVKVAADEYAKALGNNAQGGRQEIEHLLSAAQSPKQLVAALDEVDHLLATKQSQWTEQLKAVAPKSSQPPADHGAVKRETKSFREYADGYIEKKTP